MPKLNAKFNTKTDELIIQIQISSHELASCNLDMEQLEKIQALDKDPKLSSQLKAILFMLDLIEEIKEFDGGAFIRQNFYSSNSPGAYSTAAIFPGQPIYNPGHNPAQNVSPNYGAHLANAAAQTNQQQTKPPPKQPNRFRVFNHCPVCKKRNSWNIYYCVKCNAVLPYP
jgi:hypothetical protein